MFINIKTLSKNQNSLNKFLTLFKEFCIKNSLQESKDENLDFRLATHRSTYAPFKLVNVFEFRDSSTVKLFEQAIKHVLRPHCIGKVDNLKMEQYECPGEDTGLVINYLVSKQFKLMNFEISQLGN